MVAWKVTLCPKNNNSKLKTCCKFSVSDKKKDPFVINYFTYTCLCHDFKQRNQRTALGSMVEKQLGYLPFWKAMALEELWLIRA